MTSWICRRSRPGSSICDVKISRSKLLYRRFSPQSGRWQWQKISRSSRRWKAINTSMLIGSVSNKFRSEDFQIKTALPEVLSTIRPLAVAKNIQIEQKMESDQHVYADRVRFKQILYNLR